MVKFAEIIKEKRFVKFLTRGFTFVVYPSMVTCKENLSIIFFYSYLYGVKISEKIFETNTNPIRGLFIALKSPAAQNFSKIFFNIRVNSEYDS